MIRTEPKKTHFVPLVNRPPGPIKPSIVDDIIWVTKASWIDIVTLLANPYAFAKNKSDLGEPNRTIRLADPVDHPDVIIEFDYSAEPTTPPQKAEEIEYTVSGLIGTNLITVHGLSISDDPSLPEPFDQNIDPQDYTVDIMLLTPTFELGYWHWHPEDVAYPDKAGSFSERLLSLVQKPRDFFTYLNAHQEKLSIHQISDELRDRDELEKTCPVKEPGKFDTNHLRNLRYYIIWNKFLYSSGDTSSNSSRDTSRNIEMSVQTGMPGSSGSTDPSGTTSTTSATGSTCVCHAGKFAISENTYYPLEVVTSSWVIAC